MISAVVLAAGYSSRMGRFKPLLTVGGIPALERLIAGIKEAGIKNIAVVTGYRHELLQPVIRSMSGDGTVIVEAYNAGFDSGMFSSIKTGIARVREVFPDSEGCFLMPVDCPLIDSKVITTLEDAVMCSGDTVRDSFAVPVFEGKKGHPLYVPAGYAEEICSYDGPGGLKGITDKYWDRMLRVPVDSEGCILDMDTPEGYREIEDFLAAGCVRESLERLAKGRRITLVRHGQTQQHDEKMFIGQYDVPLSEEGTAQIEISAEKLVEMGLEPGRIYCSDLSRAVSSAGIIAEKMFADPDEHICPVKGLREIDLGSWDGRPVREIKEQYPEEYSRRGQNMFVFKTGNRSENFYDMQYRAVRVLRQILKADRSRDILIVAHSGIIRALQNNLRGLRVDDGWESIPKGSFVVMEN